MKIRTRYVSNASGRGGVKATANGRQKTVPWNHAETNAQNHAAAVAALIRANEVNDLAGAVVENIDNGTATHEVIDADTHVWNV